MANDKITWDEALEILKKWFEEHPQEKVTNEKQTWNDLEIDAIINNYISKRYKISKP